MKRSMTLLHSGSPTYDGEIVMPSDFTSLIQASAMDGGPRVAADRESPGDVLPEGPKGVADPLADRLQ